MENKSIDKMRLLTKLRNLGGHEHMSGQQLESLFTSPCASTSTPKWEKKFASKPKMKSTLNPKVKATSKAKSTTPELLPINTDKLEKMEMVKSRPLAENTWYE